MAHGLTRKAKKYVDEMAATGHGTNSALKAYDTTDPKTAAVISSENLKKPKILKAISEKLSVEAVEEAHASLLTAVRLDYFVFPKAMNDEEITKHVEAQGLTVLNIRQSEKGKLAFFSLPDGAARGKGIELWHKVQGSFAAEKHLNVNIEVEAPEVISELTKKLNDLYRGTGIPSDGGTASSVGAQTPDTQ